MKVLYFHQHFSTPSGGTGTRSYEFSKALLRDGNDVTVVCGSFDVGNTGLDTPFVNGRREGFVDGIKVIEYQLHYSNKQSFLIRAKQFVLFALRCCREVNKEKADLVFCTSTPLTIAVPGIYAKLIRRLPFVFEVRDLWPELPVAMGVIKNPVIIGLLKILEVLSYKIADHVITLSDGMASGVIRYVSREKNTTISNGCDLYLTGSNNYENYQLPVEIQQDDFLAIYAGTHGIANGLDVLVDTAATLQRLGHKNIKLLLVGEGMLKNELKERANDLKLKNIVFIDNLSKKQLFDLYSKCDVGLMILKNVPAFYDGTSPNKFFDYLTVGLPVICNYEGWISRLIVQENIGVNVPAESPESLADALVFLQKDKNNLSSLSMNARKLAKESFDRSMLAQQFVNVLKEVSRNGKN
ncbi:glycosyltransferase family 4 protein [Paraneptunicella aestuarii]|uniref:glycosyltransferase family 4 protein n=1 Tax=Paraneptunicella aestuarii TaxID=2831148 RepID=UPI001E4A3D52|nr:glycosyltransferase family 4 protein [Paraneptunicella aestuarii]